MAQGGDFYVSVHNPSGEEQVEVEMTLLVNGEYVIERRMVWWMVAFGVVVVLLVVMVVTVVVQRVRMNKMKQALSAAAATSAGQEEASDLDDRDVVLPNIPTFNREPVPLMRMSNGPWSEQYVHMQPVESTNNKL